MFKKIIPLNIIIGLRFLGLFIVLPVISVYALSFPGATPSIVGVVIGGYAITQMIFQIPFGIMSDKLGRSGTIIMGLLLFFVGSVFCAIATDILTLLLGRFLQGAGAIGAVVTAMISDIVKEEERTKAMGIMGATIAVAFALSMILGPIIGGYIGVDKLFWFVSLLPLISIYIFIKYVPPVPHIIHTYHNVNHFAFLKNSEILKMNITNMLQKGMMTFAFMIIPIILTKNFSWDIKELWKLYAPSMVFGIFAMGFASVMAQKKGQFKTILLLGIIFFALSYTILSMAVTQNLFIIGVIVFFIGFNMHEPIMQSLVTQYAKVYERGKVLGVFNSFGYFGTFIGGFVGGLYFKAIDGSFIESLHNIAFVIICIAIFWFLLILTLPNPHRKKNFYIPLETDELNKFAIFDTIKGIDEWYINNSEKLIIVKYDNTLIKDIDILELLDKKRD